jgi:hypothetical protein
MRTRLRQRVKAGALIRSVPIENKSSLNIYRFRKEKSLAAIKGSGKKH